MPTSLRHWVIIPAAGTSQRMGAEIPKQYLTINGTTVIEAALSNFLNHPEVNALIVAIHESDQYWHDLDVVNKDKLHTVVGGDSRSKSVKNAVAYLEQTSASENDFVLVHDAARPCLTYEDLDLLIQKLKEDEVGGILASPVCDTLKLVAQNEQDNNFIDKTLDRKNIWRALTPQMFRLKYLKQALQHCDEKNISITDEASAVEALGLPVKLIQGRNDNIKVTHQEDLLLAETILKNLNQ